MRRCFENTPSLEIGIDNTIMLIMKLKELIDLNDSIATQSEALHIS